MSEYVRGVVTTEDGGLGLLQSVNYNTSVEEAQEKDKNGNTILYENFDPKTEATIEAVFDTASTTAPDLTEIDGSAIKSKTLTISNASASNLNGKYYVNSSSITEENQGFTKISIQIKRFHANSLPAAT